MFAPSTFVWTVFLVFLKLGLTAFGGPIAHLAYFRQEFVERRGWLSDSRYTELVALCQFLPGPASSQVGIAVGWQRAGYLGAFAAWLGFTLPSAGFLIAFAYLISTNASSIPFGVLHGFKLAAIAVVIQAVWGMAKSHSQGHLRLSLTVVSTILTLLMPSLAGQLILILFGALVGLTLKDIPQERGVKTSSHASMNTASIFLAVFFILLLVLPLAVHYLHSPMLSAIDTFYRAGSAVFGGGHAVLPLLEAEIVSPQGISMDQFMAGYGITQAVPGPLFTFAAYAGSLMPITGSPWLSGMVALTAIFLPSFLLVFGVLPFWDRCRNNRAMRAALAGINAVVVGLLLATLYQPIWTHTVSNVYDVAVVLFSWYALTVLRLSPALVVIGTGLLVWLIMGL